MIQPAQMNTQDLRIEYMALSELRKRRHPDNPKDHDLGELDRSFDEFGFTSPPAIDERSGLIPFGHGREEALTARRQQGRPAPLRIQDRGDDWYVPVIRGQEFETEAQLRTRLSW